MSTTCAEKNQQKKPSSGLLSAGRRANEQPEATTRQEHLTVPLNGNFGVRIDQVTRRDLTDRVFQEAAYRLWTEHGGLLAVRGDDLAQTSPEELMAWSQVFGTVEQEIPAARDDKTVPGFPILRIGNVKDGSGKPVAQFAVMEPLRTDADIRYNPVTKRPVWHTDGTFRKHPPVGSVFHCRQAPPEGAATLFADMTAAFAGLSPEQKRALAELEAICSLAHHDKKISLYSPGFPVLSREQRMANPVNRVPIVLQHPVTGKPALYGQNSSTCAILPKGCRIAQADLDVWELEGIEDESCKIWRDLLPVVTRTEFTVKWQWRPGDIVVWDNRCTIHAATGFDHDKYTREMWRLSLLDKTN